jgi:chemosensory pili system protein ChpA (sensor histidine kinase/response regulator)
MTTILIVDDSEMIRNLYTEVLEHEGFHTAVAEDGDVGFSQLEKEHPDVVLLDLMMPNVNGFELLAKMRADDRFKETPVVIVTARTRDTLSANQEAVLKGAQAFLTKGEFNLKGLVALVTRLVRSPNGHYTEVWEG